MFQGKVYKAQKLIEMVRRNNGKVRMSCLVCDVCQGEDHIGYISKIKNDFFITVCNEAIKLSFTIDDIEKIDPPGVITLAYDKQKKLSVKIKISPSALSED